MQGKIDKHLDAEYTYPVASRNRSAVGYSEERWFIRARRKYHIELPGSVPFRALLVLEVDREIPLLSQRASLGVF